MIHFSRCIALLIVCGALLSSVDAQTATVIPANEDFDPLAFDVG